MDLRDTPHAGRYKLVFADPAWKFQTYSARGQAKSASQHYTVMETAALGRLPVAQVAAPDAWLVMWCTWPHLAHAFALAQHWSDPANPWTYRSGGAWGKRPRGWRGDPSKWQFGTGHLFRSACEPLLVFGRGAPPWDGRSQRNFWDAPIRAHSQKPDVVRNDLARIVPGPRLEMFSRSNHPGFDYWGDQAGTL